MARITVEDCLENVANRFELVLVAADRSRGLIKKNATPLIEDYRDNKEIVTSLREIAEGIVVVKQVEEEVPMEAQITGTEDASHLADISDDDYEEV